MAQFARPDSDISVTFYGGYGWSASAGSDLYAMIDEVVADDTDWAKFKGANSEAGYSYYKLGLSDIDEPSDKSTLSIRIRIHNTSDYGDLRLYEGSTLIKRFNGPSNGFGTGSKRNIDFAIPESDAENITDYTDLNLWIGIDDDSTGSAYVYQVYLEAGDATSPVAPRQMIFQPSSGNPVQNGNIIIQSPKGSITGANTISTLMGTPSAYMLTIPTTGTINANFTGAFTGCAPCQATGCESCS